MTVVKEVGKPGGLPDKEAAQGLTTSGEVQRYKSPLAMSSKAPMSFDPRSITWSMQGPPTVEKLVWSHGKGIDY